MTNNPRLYMNLRKLKNRHGKVWLNVASGMHLLEDFANLDSSFLYFFAPFYPVIRPLLKAPARQWIEQYRKLKAQRRFVFANCGKPLPLPPGSVDHILASHFVEHLYHENAIRVVKGFHTILKPGGTMHLIIPDLETRARRYLEQLGDPKAADVFVESLTYHKPTMPHFSLRLLHALGVFDAGHHWMYDQYSFRVLLQEQGFHILQTNETPSAQWRATDWGQVNLVMQKM